VIYRKIIQHTFGVYTDPIQVSGQLFRHERFATGR